MPLGYRELLRRAARRHAVARRRLDDAEAARDHIIRDAHEDAGLSVREIAELAGINKTRVGQILKARRR